MIPVQQFPIMTPENMFPLSTALPAFQQAYLSQLKAQDQQIQNKYAPQMAQAQLAQAQADVEGKQLQNKYLPVETLMEAERLKQQNAQMQQSQQRFGQLYQLNKFYSTPVGMQLLKDNPQLATSYANVVAGTSNDAEEQSLAKMAGIPTKQPTANLSPELVALLSQLFPSQQQGQSVQQPQSMQQKNSLVVPSPLLQNTSMTPEQKAQLTGITPQMVQNLQDTAGSEVIKKTVPGQVQLQRYYSESANNMIDRVDPLMESMSKYAGALGKTKYYTDKMLAQTGGRPSKEYNDYVTFSKMASQGIANELGRGFGNHATDQQKQWAQQLADPIWVSDNPKQAIQLWVALKNSIRDNEKAIMKSGKGIEDSLNERLSSPAAKALAGEKLSNKVKASDGKYYTEEEIDKMLGE